MEQVLGRHETAAPFVSKPTDGEKKEWSKKTISNKILC